MTALEEIEAAIEKLTKLRATCTPGRWLVDGDNLIDIYYEDGGATIFTPEDAYPRGDNAPAENAELVATLHRTIAAQLAILHSAVGHFPLWAVLRGSVEDEWVAKRPGLQNGIALARAINGGTE